MVVFRKNILLPFFVIVFIILAAIFEPIVGLLVIPLYFGIFIFFYFKRPKFISSSKYWKKIFKQKKYIQNVLITFALLLLAYFINYKIGLYVESTQGPALGDIVLDNLPPIDISFILLYVSRIVMNGVPIFIMFMRPTKATFSFKALAFLMILRSISLTLTELGLPEGRIPDEMMLGNVEIINFTKDLFFSGHVAYPFLGFLLLRKDKIVSYLLLASSIFMSFAVLAMHLHYTIDVVAAFFFTYGLYKMTAYVFKKDYALHTYSANLK
ncbi:sphingomyelin synthase family protein [Candidatus Woesearchaeota archaeon]|nr:sphingomyelin synthase family protein [Candidatus Woesearchaeota archaeon]